MLTTGRAPIPPLSKFSSTVSVEIDRFSSLISVSAAGTAGSPSPLFSCEKSGRQKTIRKIRIKRFFVNSTTLHNVGNPLHRRNDFRNTHTEGLVKNDNLYISDQLMIDQNINRYAGQRIQSKDGSLPHLTDILNQPFCTSQFDSHFHVNVHQKADIALFGRR